MSAIPSPSTDDADAGVSLVDQCLDLLLRGRVDSLARLLNEHPELPAEERVRLDKLAAVLGGGDARAIEPEVHLPYPRLGPYRLIRRLGQGGMGIVYLAEQAPFGRPVALKVIRPEAALSPRALARFEREAKLIARLRHDGIVTVHEAGTDNGVAFLAMELVPGVGLDERIVEARAAGGRIHVREALGICRDIARALDCAHAAGIVHRDVKPSNVRVTPDGRAKLLDFGLALDPDSASLSGTGELHGTLHYVSPEQVAGDKATIDGRTDVWSLGVTLFEALTSQLPFDGRTSQAILAQIATRETPMLRKLVPGLPREVEVVVHKSLEKDAARRYSSAAAFAEDLEALLDLRPIQARPTSAPMRTWKWCRRNPGYALAAGLSVLVVVGAPLGYGAVKSRHAASLAVEKQAADDEREAAELERSRATEEQHKAETVADFLVESLERVQFQVIYGEDAQVLRDILRESESRLARGDLASAPEAELRLQVVVGRTYALIAEFERATALLDAAIDRARQLHTAPHRDLGLALYGRADLHRRMAEFAEAEHLVREALTTFERVHPRDHTDTASACLELASVLRTRGAGDEALVHSRRALEMFRSLEGGESLAFAAALCGLGLVHQARGELDEAREVLLDARRIHERDPDWTTPDLVDIVLNLADVERGLGDLARSEADLREALDLRRRLSARDHPQLATIMAGLGEVLNMRREPEKAEVFVRDALEMRRRLYGGDHSEVASSLNDLSFLARARRDFAAAEPLQREALEMLRRLYADQDRPALAIALTNYGSTLRRLGRDVDAETYMRSGLEMNRRLFPGDHDAVANGLNNLGTHLRQLRRFDEAEALLAEAVDMRRSLFPQGHRGTAASLSNLAQLAKDRGQLLRAEDLYREALAEYTRLTEADPRDLALIERSIGVLALERGDMAAAIEVLERALAVFRGKASDRDLVMDCLESLGRAREGSGQLNEAGQCFVDALDLWRSGGARVDGRSKRIATRLVALYTRLDEARGAPDNALAVEALRREFGL